MKSLVLLLVFVSVLFAGVVSVPLTISPTQVRLVNENEFTVVTLLPAQSGLTVVATGEPGEPLLPVLSGNVLIPPDARLVAVRLKSAEWEELAQGVKIYPVQPMRPLSQFNVIPFVPPQPSVYGSDAVYPAEMVTDVPAGSKAGFRIAGFLFCPFQYYPASGRLLLATRAELEIEYENSAVPGMVLTPSQVEMTKEVVSPLVVNAYDVSRWAPQSVEIDGAEMDVAIVTSSTLAPALVGFRNYLRRKGYFAEIVPTETIYALYPGRDNPEKIRNMLKDKFAHQGLKYVILAGDVQHVPCRYGYLPYSPYDVPADLYFSDLDGSWDANNNSQFGEYSGTNHNPDSVDLYADIIVGRLPLDDASNCANFLFKDSIYERNPDTNYLHNLLLPFEALWQNIDYYGRIVNKNIALALSDMGTWLVDSVYNMSPSACIASINAGRHLFHFAGHGSYNGFGLTFNTSHLSSLTNSTKPMIVNSMACDCGNFDQYDCLAEQFITITNGGAVSTCLNARYGWGAPPNMGPSENLSMEFYHNYIKGFNQGQSYALAKDFYRNAAFSQMTYRWSLYDWTLQGDPTMLMWRRIPQQLTVNCPDTIPANPQIVTVWVNYLDSAPAVGARVAILHQDELIGRAVANSDGMAKVVLPLVNDTWTLTVSVTGQDGMPNEKTIFTETGRATPLVVYDHCEVDDTNRRVDPGDEVDLYVVVCNLGSLPSFNTIGTLSSGSPYLTIIDSVGWYDTVAVGDTVNGDAYRVRVRGDCPDGEKVAMNLTVRGDSGRWQTQFELTVGMPYARAGLWAVHDTGNFVAGVCANGGIGTTTWRGQGLGFIYPKSRAWSSSAMMHGSFLLGIAYSDSDWVADNYYGQPWQVTPQDFAVVESLRPVIPPEFGDQEYRCVFSDARHPKPKVIAVTQRSFVSADPGKKDFMILEYRIHNNDTLPISGLWAGVACDFRTAPWNSNDSLDFPGTDSIRNLAYVRATPETLALGVRAIYPQCASGYANCILHGTYISDGFTKSEKMRFLDGRLRSASGSSVGNWHAFSSLGPFEILPGDSQIVAFAICGGRTVTQMVASSDTAINWYEPQVGLAAEVSGNPARCLIDVNPRLFSRRLTIRYTLKRVEPLTVRVFDALGRCVEKFELPVYGRTGEFVWQPIECQKGVLFIDINGSEAKVIRVE
ncbi:MAG: C25 family cysteine peptidase [bacterium]